MQYRPQFQPFNRQPDASVWQSECEELVVGCPEPAPPRAPEQHAVRDRRTRNTRATAGKASQDRARGSVQRVHVPGKVQGTTEDDAIGGGYWTGRSSSSRICGLPTGSAPSLASSPLQIPVLVVACRWAGSMARRCCSRWPCRPACRRRPSPIAGRRTCRPAPSASPSATAPVSGSERPVLAALLPRTDAIRSACHRRPWS